MWRSWANCAWVRTGSRTSPVLQPLPMSLTESPRGITASTSTGSGSSGPVITEPTWISSTVIGDLLKVREGSTLITDQSHLRAHAEWRVSDPRYSIQRIQEKLVGLLVSRLDMPWVILFEQATRPDAFARSFESTIGG